MNCPRCRQPIKPGESVKNGRCPRCPKAIAKEQPSTISIQLGLPPVTLMPNSRCHYMAKSRATKESRSDSAHFARQAMRSFGFTRPMKAAACQIEFNFATKRRRDADNLLAWCKSQIDGIADAGLIENDSGITYLPVKQHASKAQPPGVVYTFTEIE